MKTSILLSDPRVPNQPVWVAIWNRVSGSLIVLMKPGTESVHGLSAQSCRCCIRTKIASAASIRMGAVEMRCWQESQLTSACGQVCMRGWERIGIWPIPAADFILLSVATLVLALHNSFEFIFKGGTS